VPAPGDAINSFPGSFFAIAIKSPRVFAGTDGCTCSTSDVNDTELIGVKFLSHW